MKQLETLKKQESKKIKSHRKKADKPWILQRKWESIADYEKYYFGAPQSNIIIDEWEDSFDKYMSPKHARQQIEKQLRTHFHGRFRVGRGWRIINKTTNEIFNIDFSDGKVAIIEEVSITTTPLTPAAKIKFKPGDNHKDILAPAMKIMDASEAMEYLQDYITHVKSEELAKNNLAYYAGYYDRETRERVEKLFNCIHPVLGPVANNLTPEEVFNMGVKMGESIKNKVETESTK